MIVTKLNINKEAISINEKYPFLVGTPFGVSLENGGNLEITINTITHTLQYSLYDNNGVCVMYRQPLREYPNNLSNSIDRVLFFVNGYILDGDLSHPLAKITQSNLSYNEVISLLKKAKFYNGD